MKHLFSFIFQHVSSPASHKPVFFLLGIFLLTACNETKTAESENIDTPPAETIVVESSPLQQDSPQSTISQNDIEFEQFEELYLNSEATLSIWPRVRAGFQLPADETHHSLQNEIDWFARHPEYLQRVMRRADPFLYYILEEAEKRKLPTELVLLPIVESAYQPFAYSHGRAAGIWQFIPSTGRLYGLKQNWWYDGRRDIYASTHAALNYLESLNKQFKGDWMLALAAYNSG